MNRLPLLIALILAACGAAAGFYSYFHETAAPSQRTAASQEASAGRSSAGFPDSEFSSRLLTALNARRRGAGYSALTADSDLARWLEANSTRFQSGRPEPVLEALGKDKPEWQGAFICIATHDSLESLLPELLQTVRDSEIPVATHCAVRVAAVPDGMQVTVVAGKPIVRFDQAVRAGLEVGESYLTECSQCGKNSAYRMDHSEAGVLLKCPECLHPGMMLACGVSGNLRPATHFLTGVRAPVLKLDPDDPVTGMLTIWKAAVSRCDYVTDGPDDRPGADHWQTPEETLGRRTGDCEDSALLVTDLLIASGYRARMALGRTDGGGHAWCVVHAAGNDYLLESTNRHPDMENLPVVQPDSTYDPGMLFDRDAIYVRVNPDAAFRGDYWSARSWRRIPVARPAPVAQTPDTPSKSSGPR